MECKRCGQKIRDQVAGQVEHQSPEGCIKELKIRVMVLEQTIPVAGDVTNNAIEHAEELERKNRLLQREVDNANASCTRGNEKIAELERQNSLLRVLAGESE